MRRANRDRLAEHITLAVVTANISQYGNLAAVLNPLADNLEIERARQRNNRAHHVKAFAIGVDIAHERTIDLQDIDGKAVQVAKR